MAYVYILKSIKNNRYYVGSTENIINRYNQHNSGNVKSTKNNRPYNLAYYQEFETINKARLIEKKIKSWKRRDYINKIIKDKIIITKGR